jgi:hypothetical protein
LLCPESRDALEQGGLVPPVRREIAWRDVIQDLDR